jgi:acetolactate synthase-1/2/3 large subunit
VIQNQTTYYTTVQDKTVAQLLLKYLELEQVNKLFGLPGGALTHLLDELSQQQDKFEYIICRHETGAAFIADGYARVTGNLGVVLVTSGPGATNALTGTVNAHNSNSALLTITGEVPEVYFGKGYLQEGIDANLDIDNIYRSASQYSAVITNATNFQTLFSQALRDALSIPNRASHISLPDDVAGSTVSNVQIPNSPDNYRAIPDAFSPGKIEQAFKLLLSAQLPLFFLGNGCRRALQDGDRLRKFVEFVKNFAIPVMTTPDAKSIFPESIQLSLRNYGLAGCEWPKYYLSPQLLNPELPPHYDALMVLGSSLGQLATSKWDSILIPNGPFIQVDLDQNAIARSFPIELGIVSEVGSTIDYLCELGQQVEPDQKGTDFRRRLIDEIKSTKSPFRNPEKRDSQASPIFPQALMKCINEMMPQDGHLFIDCANWV